MNHTYINTIQENDEINSIFLLGTASSHDSRNGPYWKLELRDATGSLNANIWSPYSAEFNGLKAGQFVEVQGKCKLYRDQLQATVNKLRILSQEDTDDLDMVDYVRTSEHNPKEMWEELLSIAKQEFTYKPWIKFVFSVFNNEDIKRAWLKATAAKVMHHAYVGGLLEHSLSVTKLTLKFCEQYPELDRQTLLAGAIFHDIGKIWELTGDLATEYTDEGRLIGHIELGVEHLDPFLKKSGLEIELIRHFKHLILSHHGSYEFGAARLPQTREALMLHYADNIDAKMAQCKALFENMANNEDNNQSAWSAYQPSLERAIHKAYVTPNPVSKKDNSKQTVQGLLV